jgi:hypothetical protein
MDWVQQCDANASLSLTLDDGTIITRCDRCRERYAERTPPGTPPCESCRVELREENEDAAAVYMTARRQYVTIGQGQVVDISIPAIKIAMDLHQVKDQRECLVRVMNTFYHFLGKADESR